MDYQRECWSDHWRACQKNTGVISEALRRALGGILQISRGGFHAMLGKFFAHGARRASGGLLLSSGRATGGIPEESRRIPGGLPQVSPQGLPERYRRHPGGYRRPCGGLPKAPGGMSEGYRKVSAELSERNQKSSFRATPAGISEASRMDTGELPEGSRRGGWARVFPEASRRTPGGLLESFCRAAGGSRKITGGYRRPPTGLTEGSLRGISEGHRRGPAGFPTGYRRTPGGFPDRRLSERAPGG